MSNNYWKVTWLPHDMEQLKALMKTHTFGEAAQVLGRSYNAIRHQCTKMYLRPARLTPRGGVVGNSGWWTEERQALLLEGISAGFNNHELAELLGTTRDAIIGKRWREGWREYDCNPMDARFPLPKHWPLLDDDAWAGCKWPFGDPQDDDFHYCGAAPAEARDVKLSYCPKHMAMAYVPERNPDRKRIERIG